MGEPLICVTFNGKEKKFQAEEISAIILSQMKGIAEGFTNKEVSDAVITVPAYFNERQRMATINAAKMAGLNVQRIINEPTAAAIAYGLDKKDGKVRNVMIFDLGGGTFDCSVINMQDGVFEVLATNGNSHLGGTDFDTRLVDFCIGEFKRKSKIDISDNKRALNKLRHQVEKTKRSISKV